MPLSTVNLSVLGIDMTEVNTDLGVFENMALTEIWLSGSFLRCKLQQPLDNAFLQFFLPSIFKAMKVIFL